MNTTGYNTIPTDVERMSLTNMLNPSDERAYQIMQEHICTLAEGNIHLCASELIGAGFTHTEAIAKIEDFMSSLEG